MRNGSVDYGRLLAAAGIAWFHSHAPGHLLAYAALPYFLVLLAIPSRAGAETRAQRLLVPFVTWSLIYALLNIALAVKNDGAPLGWWRAEMLLVGTSIHLWFLPFAFLASLALPTLRHPVAAPVCAVLAPLIFAVFGTASAAPLAQWSFGLVPVLIGISYFSGGFTTAVSTLLIACAIWYIGSPSSDVWAVAGGSLLALLLLSLPVADTAASRWCAQMSKWMYLGHPLVMVAGQTLHLSGMALGIFTIAGALILSQAFDAMLASRMGMRLRAAF